jgi:hypothetical protein
LRFEAALQPICGDAWQLIHRLTVCHDFLYDPFMHLNPLNHVFTKETSCIGPNILKKAPMQWAGETPDFLMLRYQPVPGHYKERLTSKAKKLGQRGIASE